ncbi:MAG: hypothetical protein R3C09_00070 [Pirellulaceae bacterium]|jgi:hypothetical protein
MFFSMDLLSRSSPAWLLPGDVSRIVLVVEMMSVARTLEVS